MESLKNTNILGMPTYARQSITSKIAQTTSSSHNNIKIGIKLYPAFNGQTKDWKKYKTKFSSVAAIHGIYYLMEEKYLMSDLSETNYI